MRLSAASMALGLTFLSAYRHASAFVPKGHVRHLSKMSFGLNESNESKLSATVEDTAVDNDVGKLMGDIFPQSGKDVMEVAPRLRFAPSPTGR